MPRRRARRFLVLIEPGRSATARNGAESPDEEPGLRAASRRSAGACNWHAQDLVVLSSEIHNEVCFCEVEEDFIQDDFNLTGLSSQVPYYEYALDTILDVESPASANFSDEQQEAIENAAELLYGLIHARFAITPRGMGAMLESTRRSTSAAARASSAAASPRCPSARATCRARTPSSSSARSARTSSTRARRGRRTSTARTSAPRSPTSSSTPTGTSCPSRRRRRTCRASSASRSTRARSPRRRRRRSSSTRRGPPPPPPPPPPPRSGHRSRQASGQVE